MPRLRKLLNEPGIFQDNTEGYPPEALEVLAALDPPQPRDDTLIAPEHPWWPICDLLDRLFIEHNRAREWIYKPNAVFEGGRPIDIMREGDAGVERVRSFLAAELYAGPW